MKNTLLLILAASSLSSCTMTGDPSEGGLFGWSENMHHERVAVRQNTLRSIEDDTASRNAEARAIQRKMR
jgi:hypothetical protein